MNRIRAIDTVNDTMTVEAGCILKPSRPRPTAPTGCSR